MSADKAQIIERGARHGEANLVGGLLTPEQIKALSEANTTNLFLGLLLFVLPILATMLLVQVRSNAQTRQSNSRIEERQLDLENKRIDVDAARDKAAQEVSMRMAIGLENFAREMKQLRADQNLELEDVRVGMESVTRQLKEHAQPVYDRALGQHETLIAGTEKILTGIDDTKNRVQALTQGQNEILSKLTTLPEDVKAAIRVEIDTVLAKISLIDELFTSLKPQLTAIQNEMNQRLPLPELDKVPPKTETALPTPLLGGAA